MKRLMLFIVCLIAWGRVAQSTDTTIKGDSVELVDKGESILFKGNVKLTRGADVVKANWMQTDKYKDKVKARGDVELLRNMADGDRIKAFGSEAFYNPQGGGGFIKGAKKKQSHIIYNQVLTSTSSRLIDIFADRFDFSEETSTGTATGVVYGKSKDEVQGVFEFWSDKADMNQSSKSITLTGETQPRVRQVLPQSNRLIEGDTIVYFYEGKSFEAKGRARAVFVDQKKEF